MALESLSFDPDGDLLLLLTYPPDCEDQTEAPDTSPYNTGRQIDKGHGIHDLSATTDISDKSNMIAHVHDLDNSGGRHSRQVHMLVSSRNMMLASPVFKVMLQHHNLKEGGDRKVEVPLPDDDPPAFHILLDIIHYRTREVPRQVDLKTMTNLSVLVDRYQMLEVVESYVEWWIPELKKLLPESFTPDLLPWISICWVFRLPAEFKHLTRIAMRESSGDIGDLEPDLPIPDRVLDQVEFYRQKSIFKALDLIERIITKYQAPQAVCGSNYLGPDGYEKRLACDGLILGSLLKSAATHGIWPPPSPPYSGTAFKYMVESIRSLELMALCDKMFFSWTNYGVPVENTPSHGVKASIEAEMDALIESVDGLDLHAFRFRTVISIDHEKEKFQSHLIQGYSKVLTSTRNVTTKLKSRFRLKGGDRTYTDQFRSLRNSSDQRKETSSSSYQS